MLPTGFKWHVHGDDHALLLGDQLLARITLLENGRCRICFHPDRAGMRYRFFASMATSIRYVEAWAVKWEGALREAAPGGRITP